MSEEQSFEEKELNAFVRAQAENALKWQHLAQLGQEMENWVREGHFDFIQQRVFNPVEAECFAKVKKVRLTTGGISNIAEIKGMLSVFDLIAARVESIIAHGKDAIANLQAIQNSTQEGE